MVCTPNTRTISHRQKKLFTDMIFSGTKRLQKWGFDQFKNNNNYHMLCCHARTLNWICLQRQRVGKIMVGFEKRRTFKGENCWTEELFFSFFINAAQSAWSHWKHTIVLRLNRNMGSSLKTASSSGIQWQK